MSYTSYMYLLVFLGSVFVLYTAFPLKYKWTVLLAASYVFYFINSGSLAIFLFITTAAVYISGIALNKISDGFDLVKKSLDKEQKKAYKKIILWQKRLTVTVTLAVIFGLLLFLKYFNFLGETVNSVLHIFGAESAVPKLKLILPLGISYYTLQAASYIIDVYRGKYKASNNFGKVALFLSFFPQIVEGPIGRFDLLAEPLYEGHKFNYDNFTQGLQLIVWGLFKKLVIADRANIFVCSAFENYKSNSGAVMLFAGVLYTVQIYAEFSGCMDIVTGSAQLFSVPLSENFNRPFFSKSVNEFWRRWHITLGAWLRDYIFYSVSLSKPFMRLSRFTKKHLNEFFGSLVPSAFALLFVWLANGFWHGSGWKYITYGMYYYVIMLLGMIFEPMFVRMFKSVHIERNSAVLNVLRIVRTCFIVVVGMILFRSESVGAWVSVLKSAVLNFAPKTLTDGTLLTMGIDVYDFAVIAAATAVLFIISVLQECGVKVRKSIANRNIALRWGMYFALLFAVIIFGAYGPGYDAVDFIYGQF